MAEFSLSSEHVEGYHIIVISPLFEIVDHGKAQMHEILLTTSLRTLSDRQKFNMTESLIIFCLKLEHVYMIRELLQSKNL